MITLSWPTTSRINDFLDATLAAIGRDVELYYVYSSYPCPICNLDPITNTSTNSFCTVCSGAYWVDIISGISLSGHVTWKYAESLSWYTGGKQMDGDCQVRINYSSGISELINKAKYMVVDDRTMQISKLNLLGAPEVNRIIISLKEKEKSDG